MRRSQMKLRYEQLLAVLAQGISEEDAEILRLAADGLGHREIAARVGMSRSGIWHRLLRLRRASEALSATSS